MNREEAIKKYYQIYSDNTTLAREIIKKLNYKNDHRLLQMIAESYADEALFNNSDGRINYHKLYYANYYIIKAFDLCSTCSNVLWTMGKIMKNYGENKIAVFCYKSIIELGEKKISKDSCKNDPKITLAQINDSKFELYRLMHRSEPALSKRYLNLYKKGRKKGISTLYKPLKNYLLPGLIGR